MAFQQALARITIDGEAIEHIGTLEEIVQWVEDDDENIYNFCSWNKGYTWFTDVSPYEPDGVTEEDRETYPVEREYPGGGWYLDKFLVHGKPLPHTATNVENYLNWAVGKMNPGKKWEVELHVSTVKEASDRVYDVFLSKNGQDGVKVATGTLADIVQQMQKHNTVGFSIKVSGFSYETGNYETGYEWFTDYMAQRLYRPAEAAVPTVEIEVEHGGDSFHTSTSWCRVIPMPYTVDNVSNYVHYTTVKLNNSVQWAVELREVL